MPARISRTMRLEGPETHEILKSLKKDNPELWKEKVRGNRLLETSDKKRAINTMIQTFRDSTKVRESIPIMWLSRQRFIAWQIHTEGLEKEDAAKKWEAALNSNVERRMDPSTGEYLLAQQGIPITEGVRDRERERSFSSTVACSSTEDQRAGRLGCRERVGEPL